MKLRIIQDHDELDAQWPRLLPLFLRVPRVPEYRPEQLIELARKSRAHMGYVEGDDGKAKIAFVFEFIHYPAMLAANIVALAGDDFIDIADFLFEQFRAFCIATGADAIEALVSDPMARLLSRHGFEKSCNQVRVKLGE